jgi:hypothetical protein
MEITTRNRTELKAYFVKNAIPTEGQFAELIDGMLNLKEDGIVKLPNNPLCIKAVEDEDSSKNILHFYQDFEASKPNWIFNLDPNNDENKLGFNISDGEGNSRLFIDHSTGNVGIGTTSPGAKLDISAPNEGVALKVGRKSGKPSIKGAGDWLILDGPDSGKVGLNYWANGDIILVSGGGNVGIGTKSPEVKLDVNGTIKAKSLRIDGTNEDNHLNVDGAFYRYDGQVYLTVDDNLYIRDSYGSVTAHFNTNNGRLGIGKSNPSYELDVNGKIRATNGFIFPDNSIQLSAVKIQTGTVKLADKLSKDEKLTYHNPQTFELPLSGFTNSPEILVAFSKIDANTNHYVRIEAKVIDKVIDSKKSYFKLEILTWSDSVIYRDTSVSWIAIGN